MGDENIAPINLDAPEYDDPTVTVTNFRCNARVFFLTYPRCPVPAGECLRLIRELSGERLQFICVGHERHSDGGDHLHVVFQVKRKWDIRNQRKFDLADGDTTYHCNIQAARDASHVFSYVRKAGDYEEWGTAPLSFLPSTTSKPNKRDASFAALDASTTTVEDFMSELRQKHPYEFFTRGNTIRANVEQVKRRRWDYAPRHTDFTIPGALQDWLDTEFTQEVCVISSVRRCGLRPHSQLRWLLRGFATRSPCY